MIKKIQFGKFHLPMSQTFLIRDHVFATVNIKPFLPGHILVCPIRVVPKLQDMTAQEIKQLFLTCQEVAKVLEKVYNSPYNLSMQNGKQAGQTVPHVHMHLCPIAMKGMKKRQENCMKRSEEDMAEQAARYRIYF